ncbi:M56 family metallopeptidase [Chitinophaga sp. 30R24]|uniref:M56 family metallopeptidase n=1 Tax=Chitinophaga sp. 30R24 TaxID=3248838 RepID=UPI003B8EDD9C
MYLLLITSDIVRALGWTILHSMWQAFLIFACLRIVLKLWPDASARIKYNLALLSLSGIFTWFLITLCVHLQRLQEISAAALQLKGAAALTQPVPFMAVYHNQEPLVWMFPGLENYFPILVTCYVAGMAGMTLKLLSDLFQLHQIRTTQTMAMGSEWDKHLNKLIAQLRIPRKVKLLISRQVQVPVMLGFLKPIILLPVAMVNNLTEDQLEAVLLHELAHIKRNDYLLNIFQSIVETILFFNPFVWWISKTLRIEREHCCDDLVIANTAQPLQYAHALVALEEYRLTANRLTMAAANSKQHLFHRIKRIMEMKTKHLNYSQKFLAVLIIITGLASIAWFNPVKGNGNDAAQIKFQEKNPVTNAAPVKNHSINQVFRERLNAISGDTILPVPAGTPAEPSIPAPPPAPPIPVDPLPSPPTPPAPPSAPLMDVNVHTHQLINQPYKQVTLTTKNRERQIVANDIVNKEEIRKQIREAQKGVQEAMKQLKDLNMKKMQVEIDEAIQNINWEDVKADAQKNYVSSAEAVKNINWDKIIYQAQENAANTLKNINFAAINNNLNMALQKTYSNMDEVNTLTVENIQKSKEAARKARETILAVAAQTREAAAKAREPFNREAFNADNAQREADRANREADREANRTSREVERAKREVMRNDERARIKAEREEEKAKREEEKAHGVASNYREMINKMAADHLLDPDKGYQIEKNDNGLYINGVKQSNEVTDKYGKYLPAKQMKLQGSPNRFLINTTN